MAKYVIYLIVVFIVLQAQTALCATTQSNVYKLSLTIPALVGFIKEANKADATKPRINTSLISQVQSLIRNNKTLIFNSIVLP